MRRALAAAAAGLVLAGCSAARPPAPIAAALLRVSFRDGAVLTYSSHVTSRLTATALGFPQSLDGDVTSLETVRVQSVASDGTALADITFSNTPGAPPIRLKVSPDGSLETVGRSALGFPGGDQFTPLLADHKVRPGDKWDRSYQRTNPFGSGTYGVTAHNRLLRYEKFQGRRVAVIETRSSTDLDIPVDLAQVSDALAGQLGTASAGLTGSAQATGPVESTLTSWLDPATGDLLQVKDATTLKLVLQQPAPAPPIRLEGSVSFDLSPH